MNALFLTGTSPTAISSGRRRTSVRRRPCRAGGRRGGLSIVECMISLVIAATLLTATAMAFSATTKAMKYNDEFFNATQAGRVSLLRILKQVRTGTVSEKNPLTGVDFNDNDVTNVIEVVTPDTIKSDGTTVLGKDYVYKYDSTTLPTPTLRMWVKPYATNDPGQVLARNLTSLTFRVGIGTDANNHKCVSLVTVNIVVKIGNNEVRLSGSAAPRQMLTYK